jgi:hypothetical protein
MAHQEQLALNDIVVSRVPDGHMLLIVGAPPAERLALLYRGIDWTVQYAVARGARVAGSKGGKLWYTTDQAISLEFLETFRREPSFAQW